MTKYKKLVNNSFTLTIGNFGSKIINFIMVPLYTNILSTQDYGIVDLAVTTVNLFIPLVTLELGTAALRYTINSTTKNDENIIFNIITKQGVLSSLFIMILIPLFSFFNVAEGYEIYIALLLIMSMFNNFYSQYMRGLGLVKQFAINGILMTLVTVSSNIFFLLVLKLRVEGYLTSLLLSNLVSNLYMFYTFNGFQRLSFKKNNSDRRKKMLRFSLPIIPNSGMWWLINGSTRYFILYFVGTGGNGLFAVASKIPGLISMFTGIFSQAWQLSSFEEYNSDDKDEFYSNIFSLYSALLFIAGSSIMLILKPFFNILISESYYESLTIVPWLILGVIYQSYSSFLGTNYSASMQTKGALKSATIAGVVSIIMNITLIPILGILGASIGSFLSFVSMFVYRYYDTQQYVKININFKFFFLTNITLMSQILFLNILDGPFLLIIEFFLLILIIFINKKILLKFLKSTFEKKIL